MEALENHLYQIWYIIANTSALLLLFCSWKFPRTGRLFLFLLFGWACWMNWTYAARFPNDYLAYADLAFLPAYKTFILGWFSKHILLMVACIATCQGMIAVSMLLNAWLYKIGLTGGIVFLLAIIPLGVGSGFPCTFVTAIAMCLLWKEHPESVWHRMKKIETGRYPVKFNALYSHPTKA